MTLITRLSAPFTDTTLPKLVKDPAIVDGTRLLVDMKSVGTWLPQTATITTSDPLYNLSNTTWPTLATRGVYTYSPTRGGIQGNISVDANSGLWLSDTTTNIFNDATHAWAFTFWFYRGAATAGTFSLIDDNAVSITSNGTGGPVVISLFGNNGTNNQIFLLGANYSILRRIGFVVYQDGSNVWKYRSVTDNTVSAESSLVGATNTVGGAGIRPSNSSTLRPRVFPVPAGYGGTPSDYLFYRTFVEDLTVSGRTYQQALDADWARGNGRYS